ncbi:MAG: hypothetical protein JWP75_3416 [Frondihabitans sp.]|nr:hypothetical protein [Frondihabitans sp.]
MRILSDFDKREWSRENLGDRLSVGVRELKQNASRVIAEVEEDHEIRVVTVNGRPAAGLVPLEALVPEAVAHELERIGISSVEFDAGMARFPIAAMSQAQVAEWLADVRDGDSDGEIIDPWERAGL